MSRLFKKHNTGDITTNLMKSIQFVIDNEFNGEWRSVGHDLLKSGNDYEEVTLTLLKYPSDDAHEAFCNRPFAFELFLKIISKQGKILYIVGYNTNYVTEETSLCHEFYPVDTSEALYALHRYMKYFCQLDASNFDEYFNFEIQLGNVTSIPNMCPINTYYSNESLPLSVVDSNETAVSEISDTDVSDSVF